MEKKILSAGFAQVLKKAGVQRPSNIFEGRRTVQKNKLRQGAVDAEKFRSDCPLYKNKPLL